MKWILIALGILVGLAALVTLVGALLPKGHEATRTARFRQPPEAVWQVITDFQASSSWRTDLRSVERLPDLNGHPVWKEVDKQGQALPLEVVEQVPPRLMVTRIADPDLPFGGTWTWEIAPDDDGCSLTITERGEVRNPIFRFVARFVLGHTATMDGYLKALGRKLGEGGAPA